MLTVASSFVARPGPALADANEVSISPAAIEVAPGGSATVQLIVDPPAETLAIWVIDVAFDPDVVSTSSRGCDSLDPLANSTTVGVCVVNDKDGDGVVETVKVLGAIVFNDDGSGLGERTVLADITFEIVGEPGRCTDLHLRVQFHADPDGEETNPLLSDGEICIESGAPPSGTVVPHTPELRTSEPTPTGGAGLTPPPLNGGVPAGGGGTPADGDETPTNGDETPAGGPDGVSTGQTASQTASPGESGEDGGGGGVLIWALIIVAALVVTAGLAWAAVRRRGAGSGPEGGSSAG